MRLIPELMTTADVREAVRTHCRERRLGLNVTQEELARRSGVSLGSLKRFEGSGEISLSGLIALGFALGCLGEFLTLFPPIEARSLNELTREPPKRVRARKRAER